MYHQAATITKATTIKITRAVFLSNPEATTVDGVAAVGPDAESVAWAKAVLAEAASREAEAAISLITFCIVLDNDSCQKTCPLN